MARVSRRGFLQRAAVGAAAAVVTYSLGRSPAVSSADAPSARAEGASALAAQDGAWAREWEGLIAAARREGRLSLLSVVGSGYGAAIESFERAFPGIAVDWLAESSASVWLEEVRQRRRAGSHAFDLAFVQPDRALAEGAPEGIWAPIKPLLFRPDVLDERAWRNGLDARYLDAGGSLCFAWEYQVVHAYAINTDLVGEGEITTVRDLLDPRWKGRILSLDPRLGSALLSAANVARTWGADVVRQLLVDQQPMFRSWGPTEVTEALVRGQYPIALGVRPKALNPLHEQGLGHQIRYLDLPDADFVATMGMLYFDTAPHPAAARLFANWILTQEAQTLLTRSLATNSARSDVVAFEPDGVGTAGLSYYEPDREANYAHTAATRQLVHDLLGGAG